MFNQPQIVMFIAVGFMGLSLLIGNNAHAQTDDDSKVDMPASIPDEGSKIDWSQAEMLDHEPLQVTDAPTASPELETVVSPPSTPNFTTYTIQRGDTLYKIARRFGVNIAVLISVNKIADPSRIYLGQVLQIPGDEVMVEAPQTVTESFTTAGVIYTIQRGDTLIKIATRFGIDLKTLATVNDISNPSFIRVGQVLQISSTTTSASPSTNDKSMISDQSTATNGQVYSVQPGDSLTKIARRFGTASQMIAAANKITNPSLIYPGQTLIITTEVNKTAPAPPPQSKPAPSSEFVWPVDNRDIVKGFQSGHRAIDILLPIGSPVYASASGKVEYAGWNGYGYGNLVVIDHGDGWRTLYAHNSALKVSTGDTVEQGNVIASSGNTGNSTMPHIHLEMMRSKQAQNPCLYLLGGC